MTQRCLFWAPRHFPSQHTHIAVFTLLNPVYSVTHNPPFCRIISAVVAPALHQMAYVEKRGKVWRALIRRKGFRTESATFRLKAQADAWVIEREAELLGSRHGIIPKRTVRQAIERYQEEVCPTHEGRRWEQIRLAKILRGLAWADRQLGAVSGADIALWRDSLQVPDEDGFSLAPASARREYGLLRAVFNTCASPAWGWLKDSPFEGISPPPDGRERNRRVPDADADVMIDALGYARGATPTFASQYVACAFLFGIETAMRKSEILAIEPRNVNDRVVHVPRSKNGESRDVPLTKAAKAILDICGNEFPVSSGTADALFRKARDKTALGDIHFHDSRREGTTRLAEKVDVLTLAKITGHKDIKLLLRVYYAPRMADVALRLD